MFEALDMEPKYSSVPVWLFDSIIITLQTLATVTKAEQLENAAEIARIGKYYAVEDMVTTLPDEKYGTITLKEHYENIVHQGQEYDPYIQNVAISNLAPKVVQALITAVVVLVGTSLLQRPGGLSGFAAAEATNSYNILSVPLSLAQHN